MAEFTETAQDAPAFSAGSTDTPTFTAPSAESIQFGSGFQKRDTLSNQLGAGVDQGQALFQRAGQALAEIVGLGDSEFAAGMAKAAADNERQAARVPVDGIWDMVQRGAGTLAVGAVPAVASLPLGGAAAIATGVMSSAGLNLGDIQSKKLSLDEEAEANAFDLTSAVGLGSLEAIPLLRFRKALQPVSDAVKKGLVDKTAGVAGDVARSSAQGGIIEGAQDFSTSYLSAISTDTPITSEMVDRWVDDSIDEAIVGAILSGPIGAGESAVKYLQNQQAIKDESAFYIDEDGRQQLKLPVEDKLQSPGIFKQFLASTVGKVPDKIMVSEIGKLGSVRQFLGNFAQNARDIGRAMGISTINNRTHIIQGDMRTVAKDFLTARKKDARAAVLARRNKETPTDPRVQKALASLNDLLDNESFRVADLAGLTPYINWRGNDYIPLMNVDVNYVTKNRDQFIQDAMDDAVAAGKSDTEVRQVGAKARAFVDQLNEKGFYNYSSRKGTSYAETIVTDIREAQTNLDLGIDPDVALKDLRKPLASINTSKTKKDNAFDQERFLGQLSESFWDKYTTDDAQGNIRQYIHSIAERAAHSEKFGPDHEGYYEEVRRIFAEAAEKGIRVTSKDVKNFVDLISISQRLPTVAVSPGTRKAMNVIRAFENITLLPLSLFASISEVLLVTSRNSTTKTLSAVGKSIKDSAINTVSSAVGGKKIAPSVAEDLDLAVSESMNIQTARASVGAFELSGIEQNFFKLTLLPQFTESLRMMSANAAYKSLIRDIETFLNTNNKGVQRNIIRKVSELGLDVYKVADWYRGIDTGVAMDKNAPYYKDHIRNGILNVVEDTVVNPAPINRPGWTSDQRLQLLAQMKSFMLVFSNTVMRGWYDQISSGGMTAQSAAFLRIMPLMGMMMAIQIYMGAVREFAKTGATDRWSDDDFIDHFLLGFSYMGMGGFIADPIRSDTFGSDASSVLLGPAVADFNNLMSTVNQILTGNYDPASAVKRVVKTMPDLGLFDDL